MSRISWCLGVVMALVGTVASNIPGGEWWGLACALYGLGLMAYNRRAWD